MNVKDMCQQVKANESAISRLSSQEKNHLLSSIVTGLDDSKSAILEANNKDVEAALAKGTPSSMVDRLRITDKTIEDMKADIQKTITLEDPIGQVDGMWLNDAGLTIGKKRVPLGVIAIIYESRPNVTIDAASLCLKTGNAVILKGGSDALETNRILIQVLKKALRTCHLPEDIIGFIDTTDREATRTLLLQSDFVDCVIPRGGAGLIKFTVENSKIPIIETGTGNCHIFIDSGYEVDSAIDIIINAKTQKPGACNAVETVLLHQDTLESHLLPLAEALRAHGVLIRAESSIKSRLELAGIECEPASEVDYMTEYLDYTLCLAPVKDVTQAISHINTYSTHHSEAILTHHYDHSQIFLNQVDSAAVYINASTRFTDGSMFGFGAEIGISTQKLHARGPMGLEALTTYKYIIYGNGQIR